MDQLIPFKIKIHGKHSDMPHPFRIVKIEVEPVDFDDLKLMVVLYNCFNKVKTEYLEGFPEEDRNNEMQRIAGLFTDYHIGTKRKSLINIEIEILGLYCENPHPERYLVFHIIKGEYGLKGSSMQVLMYEMLCVLRNKISKNMSRKELAIFAQKYNISSLGMLPEEKPFVTRD